MQNTKVSWLAATKRRGVEIEMDITVRIKLQTERGWVWTGRNRGRNVNASCFAFPRAFSPSQHVKLSFVWQRELGKESDLVALRGLYPPRFLGNVPTCRSQPSLQGVRSSDTFPRRWPGAQHGDPLEVQGPSGIWLLLRRRQGSKPLPADSRL